MYTDNRFCAACCDKGLYRDGENYCTQCKSYLCLPCTKTHGQICAYSVKDNVKHRFQHDVTKTQRMECFSETSHLNSRSREIDTSDANESVQDERRQLIEKAKGRRQAFSARGGTVRVAKISFDVNRVKLQRCGEHPDFAIENFCNIHNDLCCEKCLYENHDRCIVQPIDEVAHGIFVRGEVEKAEKAFKDLKERNTTIATKCEMYLVSMQQRSQGEKEEKARNVADKNKETDLKRMLAKCNDLDENISIALSEIRNAKESASEVLTFVTLQKNKKTFIRANAKLLDLAEAQSRFPLGERIMKQTRTSRVVKSQAARATVGEDINRKTITTAKTQSNYDYYGPAETDNNDTLPNKTIIGEVILYPFGEHEKEQNQSHKINNHQEIQEVGTIHNKEEYENDLEHNKYEMSENEAKHILTSSTKIQPVKKNVGFIGKPVISSVFRTPFKDRVKTNGLVTEYYLDDNYDVLDGIRILRLQSAPTERCANPNQDTAKRHKSVNESREPEHWQHKKMLESVEYEKESNDSSEMTFNTSLHQGCIKRSETRQNTVKSTRAITDNNIKLIKHDTKKHKTAMKYRPKTTPLPSKKSLQLRKRSSQPKSAYILRNYKPETEAQRLKQWIKRTEEINRKYKNDCSEISTLLAGSENKETDAIDKVYAANVHDILDINNDEQELQTVPLLTKEATVIKIMNPDERQSSAKSRTSDSEESLYNSQAYAHPPKSQLLLSDEQIIRLPEDERVCEINSITCLPDGRIVVSDFSNMAIKMFRVGWGKSSVLTLDEPPHDITVVSNSIIAVIFGLAYDKLLVVNIGHFPLIKKRFKTGCMCKAISSYESHIYLLCLYSYKTEIRIMTIDGIVSFRLDLGHAIPSPKSIALKASDGLIYILDQNEGIFSVKLGKIVSRSFDRNIESYIDIEVDINNNLFICTKNPGGIYELNYDGKHLMPILLGYGVENIKAIAYNVANNSLVVGCADSETIQIYKINDTVSFKKK